MSLVQFLELFLSISLQATLYVCLCAGLARWTSSDRARSQLWMNCQFGLLGLALLGCTLPHFRLVHSRELSDPQTILQSVNLQNRIGQICLTVWLVGFGLSLLRVVVSGLTMARFVRQLRPLDPARLPLSGLGADEKVLLSVKYYLCDFLTSPFCWQFQRPVMVLPRAALNFSPSELQLILKHELAHLRADHPLQLFIQQLVQCLYWFHPAAYWAGKQADTAREMMCDAAAAESPQDIANYLRVLLKVSEMKRPALLAGQAGLGIIFQRELSILARRARRLAERAKQGPFRSSQRGWMALGPFALVVVVTTFWLPVNVLSSPRSNWSACPTWTAEILHDFGVNTRDYEVYDGRLQIFDRDFEDPAAHD